MNIEAEFGILTTCTFWQTRRSCYFALLPNRALSFYPIHNTGVNILCSNVIEDRSITDDRFPALPPADQIHIFERLDPYEIAILRAMFEIFVRRGSYQILTRGEILKQIPPEFLILNEVLIKRTLNCMCRSKQLITKAGYIRITASCAQMALGKVPVKKPQFAIV